MGIFLSDEQIKKFSKWGMILIGFLSFAVLGLIILAMINYPGEYDFFKNYISDLGRKFTEEGYDNSISSSIYMLAMLMLGLVSTGFWFFSQNIVYHVFKTKWKYLVILGSLSGIISSIVIGLTGFFPLDTASEMHNLLGMIYFALGGIALSLYSIFFIVLFFSNKDDIKVIVYAVISVIIPIIFAFIVVGILDEISTVYIVGLVLLLLIVNVVFLFAFKNFISYLSYLISFSMLVLEVTIVLLVISVGIKPIIEVSFVLGMVTFMMINNARIIELDI